MSVTQEIKNLAIRELGMTICGIAPVSRFHGAPEGKRPCDLLPGAKSVIVFGVRLVDGAMQAIFRKYEEGKRNAHGIYATYASTIAPNLQLGFATQSMANFIESRTGAIAVPTTNGPFQATSSFSQRRAAVAAGLGQYSWSGYVVNAEYGPRMRYGSVITTLELEYDEMDNGPRLCDPSSCRICVDKCPAKAIAPYPEAVEEKLGDAVELHARFDRNRCQSACFGLIKETSTVTGSYTADQRTDLVNPDCVTDEEFMRGIKALSPSLSGLQLYPNWKCALCLAYCPLGRWKERFFDTGLSKGEFDLNIKQISRVQDDVEKDGARTNAQLV